MDDNPAEDDENEEEEEEEAEMHFNIDESVFDELHNFTNFLIGGNAFQGLSRNVEQFVSAPVQAAA
ncbi:hypothetical protein HBI70_010610 [Parastagonospora nodorum]|nr:hypothetical protein HBH52_090140 [Parastagonospora nodorum]KAH4920891.1 hypothetical protein HBI79_191310 [Parastagonospora nodorum]KAH5071093.1 hypothetical protein HBH96_010350 [Parastagonospora nodorum]KAH5288336.1 hypothetical protein HBI70_010610 [Parastagonospora nodorum]KAH5375275.1 hypothetical protein HBI49_052560 [Parastagonospora nodorum]